MNDRTKNITVTIVFIVFFAITTLLILFHKPNEISENERRKLAQLPELSGENILSSKYMDEFDKYTLDQFPFRDTFRHLKVVTQLSVFHQKDNNGIYIVDNTVSKIEYPLKENSVINAADKFKDLYDTYCLGKDVTVYYSIIPDKNYFIAKANGYPSMDYDRLVTLLKKNLDSMKYIDIFDCLSIEDYYSTDTHWRQEKLTDAVERIAKEMGFFERLTGKYKVNKVSPFYGVYYGQAALPMEADTIYYLTNDITDSCKVYNYETDKYSDIYDLEKSGSNDPYEMFLSGAVPLLTIENPNAESNKELVIFRDSFGSSISPLFAEAYSKITLIDIRYIASDYLENFITFDKQDVLFLYSTLVINNSTMLK
ncbi:MAG: DHHW family protein [Mobilitalea sp.]